MKIFFNSIRDHATNILNFENKKMLLLTKEELKWHQMQEIVIFVEKESRLKQKLSES